MRTGPKFRATSGDVVNPIDGQVLCDSGVLPTGGAWLLSVTGYCDAAFKYRVVRVGTGEILDKRFPAAGDVDLLVPNHEPFPQGERLQVVCTGGATSNLFLAFRGVLLE